MKPSESQFVSIRGLQYHCRVWGRAGAPRLYCLHGWMDVSASFQFLVDALAGDWQVIAPDWRGYGLTDWAKSDSYWFPDYLADLESLLDHYQAGEPATLIGHSMGGNVACLYAGVRPGHVARLINLEGFGLAAARPDTAPRRYTRWLDEIAEGVGLRKYDGFDALAARLLQNNPRLTAEHALFLARHWGREEQPGVVVLRADPAHKRVNPVQYRLEEARACWGQVIAPVLWVDGAESTTLAQLGISPEDHAMRKACFKRLSAHTVPEAGHMLHLDQPEQLAELIERFLQEA